MAYVPKALRKRLALQARSRCGYCLTSEVIVSLPMEIEHIIPESLGGPTEEDNLWLACSPCNTYKSDRITARDPFTDEVVPLFNPRHQLWHEHFTGKDKGARIDGVTPTGRATVEALVLNRPVLVRARQVWNAVGWHPPKE